MSKFDDMIYGLKCDTKVPDHVWTKYTDTLSKLPDKADTQNIQKNHWIKYAVSAAAVVIVGTTACCTNSALAAKIPFIGRIFEEVQQISTFSGKYDDKSTILTTEDVDTNTLSNSDYSVTSAGVTFTASEIYCDGLSLFLTAEIDVEQGGLENIPGNIIYLDGNWKTSSDDKATPLLNNNLEGKIIDDQTFIGMLKLDLNDLSIQNDILELNLSFIGYDDLNEMDTKDSDAFYKIEGEWTLSLPFSVDREAVKTIPVNLKNNSYCLKEVFVSPYQVITFTDVPYSENTMTEEEFDKMMETKTEGASDTGLTYEEYMAQEGKIYAYCDTIIFNQDGERLRPEEEFHGRSVNAVQGKEISKLYIYIFDDFDAWMEMNKNGMDCDAANQAVITAEVDIR